jgi:hypothetical protein
MLSGVPDMTVTIPDNSHPPTVKQAGSVKKTG